MCFVIDNRLPDCETWVLSAKNGSRGQSEHRHEYLLVFHKSGGSAFIKISEDLGRFLWADGPKG